MHLLNGAEEGLHSREEGLELLALAKALHVALERVPQDSQYEALGLLAAPGELVALTVWGSDKADDGLLVGGQELLCARGFDLIANVLDDHGARRGTTVASVRKSTFGMPAMRAV